jgi:hypothetical protein
MNPRILVLIGLALAALAPAVHGGEAQGWAVSLGGFNLADDSTPEAGVEYRLAPFAKVRRGAFLPAVGVSGTSDGNVWVYGSLRFDWRLDGRWTVTPQVGASLYEDDDGLDLGGPLEFRSGLELTYRLARGARLGFVFYHLSNARIYDDNPGSNSLVVTYGFGR